jgi:hypothetical protein
MLRAKDAVDTEAAERKLDEWVGRIAAYAGTT